MIKLIAPAFALALLSPAVGHAQPPASATAQVKVSDGDALRDDILGVLDLPFAAAEARSAGVDEAELKQALDVSRDVGLSAGEAADIVAEETTAASKRGHTKGFGQYVRVQLAAGLRGKQLAAKIRARKAELKELTPDESDKLKTRLDGVREQNRAHRLRALERRKELIAGGKKAVFVGQERHQAHLAKFVPPADKAAPAGDAAVDARLRVIEDKIAATEGPEKDALEAERRRLLKASGKLETRENKLETRENKLEARPDKLEARPETKADKHGSKHEAKADIRAAGPQ